MPDALDGQVHDAVDALIIELVKGPDRVLENFLILPVFGSIQITLGVLDKHMLVHECETKVLNVNGATQRLYKHIYLPFRFGRTSPNRMIEVLW